MGVYTFNCPECRSRFDSESSVQWSVDQTATVACQVGKRPKCTVYCVGEVVTTAQTSQPATSATPTISLDDAPPANQRVAYLEVQTIDGGIGRLLIGEGLIQTYGRKSDFDVCDHPVDTEDRKMSRVHFQIESRMHNRQPSYIISDMGSIHGTRVMRQVGGNTNTIQLYVNKDNKQEHDGVCLEQNDLIIAGNTMLRFGVDLLAAPVITPDTSAPPEKFDPNRTTVF